MNLGVGVASGGCVRAQQVQKTLYYRFLSQERAAMLYTPIPWRYVDVDGLRCMRFSASPDKGHNKCDARHSRSLLRSHCISGSAYNEYEVPEYDVFFALE